VRDVLEEQNLRAVIAELADKAHYFEETPAPLVIEAEL